MSRYYDDELYHHGIKGQRWGVRRFQQKDGSLTSAGKKRYSNPEIDKANKDLALAKKKYKSSKSAAEYLRAKNDIDYAKRNLSDVKAQARMSNDNKPKSKRRLSLEEEYKKQGFTAEEAEIQAYKRNRTEKILKTAAVVGVTAAAIYVGKKMYDYKVDKVIPKGTLIQNISDDSNKGVRDAFYGAINKGDKQKYLGLYGKQIADLTSEYDLESAKLIPGKALKKDLITNENLKIASQDSAKKVLSALLGSDEDFKKSFGAALEIKAKNNIFDPLPKRKKLREKAFEDFSKGKITDNVYNAFNIDLVLHDPDNQKLTDKFYSALKDSGYDAVKDINDYKYSGYKAKNPLIFINSGKMTVSKVKDVPYSQLKKKNLMELGKLTLDYYAPRIGVIAGVVSGKKALKRRDESAINAYIVKNYRKKHPNSKLSYNEIIRMQKKSKIKK